MPRVIDGPDGPACTMAECIAALEQAGFDPGDEPSLRHAALWLRRLGNNRDFLAELLLEQLRRGGREEDDAAAYGAQVVMLARSEAGFLLRANVWPSADEHAFRASGADAFVYGLAHDHNFDFLTLGYVGPGYGSDDWEYDYEAVAGALGEPAGLRFAGRTRLAPGRILHYRAHRDVHAQHPPDALSVSLNVMHAGGAEGWLDQYRFDIDRNRIADVLAPGASQVFLRVAVGLGCAEALDLAERFARSHPSDRMRLTALEAQAGTLGLADRDALWRKAERSGSRLVAAEARRRREKLEP